MLEFALHRVVRIGAVNVPLWVILLVAGYASAYIVLLLSFRDEREVRKKVADRVSTAVIIAFVVWKIAPGLMSLRIVFERPLYLFYATGGVIPVVSGIGCAAIYLIVSFIRLKEDDPLIRRSLLLGAGRFIVVAGFAFFAGALIVAASSRSDRRLGAPPISLVSLTGEQIELSEYRGKTVVLNFWATWCPPCRAEMPLLVEYARSLDRERTVLISVNQTTSEESLETLTRFADSYGIEFPVLLDPNNGVFTRYGVRGIPTTFIIDTNGEIVARRTGVVSRGWLNRYR